MSDVWKQFEGQVVDEEFPLQQYLAGNEHSAVFLTQHGDSQPQKAAIKLIPADPATSDLQLSRWRLAAQLSHPNLLLLWDFGRCRLDNVNFLYVVMQYAEEDLSQILPQRPLTPAETRDMLEPVLDVLVYLHGKGLVHGRLKPSNIHAMEDQLKLSSDSLASIAESRAPMTRPSPYNAPEVAASGLSPASDVWSLGMTLVEVLTQRAPVLPPGIESNGVLPDTLPQPYLDIARHALLAEPQRRWTTAEIAARLNPAAIAAAAGQSISPLAVPLSSVPALPAAKLHTPEFDSTAPNMQSLRQPSATPLKQTLVLPSYVVPVAAALLVLVAIVALPKMLKHRQESSPSVSAGSAPPVSQPKSAAPPAHQVTPPPAKTTTPDSLKIAAEKKHAQVPPPMPSAATPAPAVLRTHTFPSANATKPPGASLGRGEVLDQVLPEVSQKARGTIHGKVRVSVRVKVEPAGNVSRAELDSPGPSKYFADLALEAARRWEFSPPEINGHSAPSEWLIRFEFSPSGTQAFPRQTTP
jgi:eukaryotic-like serine/threonine-protein kinase